jgi:hypothetical protein
VWDPYLQKDIDRLESIQRRSARFVYNDYGRTSVTEMMKKLDWKPLSERPGSGLRFRYTSRREGLLAHGVLP